MTYIVSRTQKRKAMCCHAFLPAHIAPSSCTFLHARNPLHARSSPCPTASPTFHGLPLFQARFDRLLLPCRALHCAAGCCQMLPPRNNGRCGLRNTHGSWRMGAVRALFLPGCHHQHHCALREAYPTYLAISPHPTPSHTASCACFVLPLHEPSPGPSTGRQSATAHHLSSRPPSPPPNRRAQTGPKRLVCLPPQSSFSWRRQA